MEDCKTAKFGNCPQNMNQFNSLSECQDRCRDPGQHAIKVNLSESIYCRLQPDFGQCNDYYPLWYFDISIRSCRGFSYSGCGGNHNRFPNAQICAAVCGAVVTYL
ncbi:PI-actitoxin-Aeq3a-like [Ostrinia furnacalis]|nr:PI-actitoxin-Aeq3a-like [Ostrinia furnacalis]